MEETPADGARGSQPEPFAEVWGLWVTCKDGRSFWCVTIEETGDSVLAFSSHHQASEAAEYQLQQYGEDWQSCVPARLDQPRKPFAGKVRTVEFSGDGDFAKVVDEIRQMFAEFPG